jgi:hypothetical protein
MRAFERVSLGHGGHNSLFDSGPTQSVQPMERWQYRNIKRRMPLTSWINLPRDKLQLFPDTKSVAAGLARLEGSGRSH